MTVLTRILRYKVRLCKWKAQRKIKHKLYTLILEQKRGIQKGQKFTVYIEMDIAGELSLKEIGRLNVKEVLSGARSLCSVSKGGEEIMRATKEERKLIIISRKDTFCHYNQFQLSTFLLAKKKMKLRILLLSLLATYTIHLTAQELYSNDLSCVKADNNLAVIAASGIAEKKKDVYSMALKSIFNALFLNGIDGVENGRPLVGKEDSYYMNQFFNSRYMLFVKNYETVEEPVRQSSRLYKGTVTAQILLGALKKDLIRNKLMTKPMEEMSMEETRQQVALPTIMVVPYKSNDRSSYAGILKMILIFA